MSIERRLGQRLHVFSNMVQGFYFRRTEQPLGVALAEWRVLRSVIDFPEITQGEIAAAEGLNVMNVSRAVAGLRDKGLIDVETDPDDRRRTLLSATEVGEGIGADIARREQQIYGHFFSVLSSEELRNLDALMAKVNDQLRSGALPEPPPMSQDWSAANGD